MLAASICSSAAAVSRVEQSCVHQYSHYKVPIHLASYNAKEQRIGVRSKDRLVRILRWTPLPHVLLSNTVQTVMDIVLPH